MLRVDGINLFFCPELMFMDQFFISVITYCPKLPRLWAYFSYKEFIYSLWKSLLVTHRCGHPARFGERSLTGGNVHGYAEPKRGHDFL